MVSGESGNTRLTYKQLCERRVREQVVGLSPIKQQTVAINGLYGLCLSRADDALPVIVPAFVTGMGQANYSGQRVHTRFFDKRHRLFPEKSPLATDYGLHAASVILTNGLFGQIENIDGTDEVLAIREGFFIVEPNASGDLTPLELNHLKLKSRHLKSVSVQALEEQLNLAEEA